MRSVNEVVYSSTAAVARLLKAEGVWFEPWDSAVGAPDRRITATGTLEGIALRATADGYDLGSDPLELEVGHGDRYHGRLVVSPAQGESVSLDARLGAVIVAQQLALALSTTFPASTGPAGRQN
jgi:hypothetical protein